MDLSYNYNLDCLNEQAINSNNDNNQQKVEKKKDMKVYYENNIMHINIKININSDEDMKKAIKIMNAYLDKN